LLLGYGFRIQKSAFEASITKKKYKELLECLPAYASEEESIRVYKIIGKGQITTFGKIEDTQQNDIIVI
jgi:CRISPR-associated endoribonuclease Cas2